MIFNDILKLDSYQGTVNSANVVSNLDDGNEITIVPWIEPSSQLLMADRDLICRVRRSTDRGFSYQWMESFDWEGNPDAGEQPVFRVSEVAKENEFYICEFDISRSLSFRVDMQIGGTFR